MSTSKASATAVATPVPSAPPQGGVLEGVNPTHFDPKNPLILFIIQVRWELYSGQREGEGFKGQGVMTYRLHAAFVSKCHRGY